MFTKVKEFFKKETVCCIAFLLAVVSMFFIPPSVNYFSYIDFRVLALLFSLMAVVRGFSSIGVFTRLGTLLLHKVHSLRTLAALFVFLCFFFSMLITNDVALITFVPFTILVLSMADQRQALIPVIVLETIAANLGSMLTPLGNPQNLYLYTISGLSLWDFIRIMLPYSAVSALLLILFLLVLCFMLRWSNMRKDARRQELLKKKAEYEATQQSAEDTPAEAVSAEDMTVDGAPVPAEAPAETTEKESDI